MGELRDAALSQSRANVLRKCFKAYDWRYVKGLQKKDMSDATTLGTLLHGLLAAEMASRSSDPAVRASVTSVEVSTDVTIDIPEGCGGEEALRIIEAAVADTRVLVLVQARNLVRRARLVWDLTVDHLPEVQDVLAVEQRLEHEGFMAIVDLVYVDKDGRVVVLDWKTSKYNPPKKANLLAQNQLPMTAWIVHNVMGHRPEELEWFYINTAITDPKPITLNENGRIGSQRGGGARRWKPFFEENGWAWPPEKPVVAQITGRRIGVETFMEEKVGEDPTSIPVSLRHPVDAAMLRGVHDDFYQVQQFLLNIDPLPTWKAGGTACNGCAYRVLCQTESLGIDPSVLIEEEYVHVHP